MLAIERHKFILDYLKENKVLKIQEIAKILDVTSMTVNRDIQHLEEKGLLEKTFGGAILPNSLIDEKIYSVKKLENYDIKKKLAEEAFKFIEDGMTIVLDAGTTTFELSNEINKSNLNKITVITNDLNISLNLFQNERVNLILLGGVVQRETAATVDNFTIEMLDKYYIDIAFLGSASVSDEYYITTPTQDKMFLKNAMLRNSNKKILLVDESKFNKKTLHKICKIDRFDHIITNYDFNTKNSEKLNLNERLIKVE
ncbi:MAG: DeoR/GlpR family DNA-binding transcription regulator [Fusobacteriaceae bacterium]